MWIFDTTSVRGKDEYPDPDLWFVTHIFPLRRISPSSWQRQREADRLFWVSLEQLGQRSTMRWRRVSMI